MKTRITIALLLLTVFGWCYAKRAGWNNNVKPKIPLMQAHQKALDALKSRNLDYYWLTRLSRGRFQSVIGSFVLPPPTTRRFGFQLAQIRCESVSMDLTIDARDLHPRPAAASSQAFAG